jgi:hypothetical protein
MDDGTPWSSLADPAAAVAAAAADTGLMAGRCNVAGTSSDADASATAGGLPWCTWFSIDGTANLHTYMPMSTQFITSEANKTGSSCSGTYVRSMPVRGTGACSRLMGYVFHPYVSLPPSQSYPVCSQCWNSTALAASCNATRSCPGFSNMLGLLPSSQSTFNSPSSFQLFTTTPCFGSFQKVDASVPGSAAAEQQALETLLCGTTFYCDPTQITVSTSASINGLDVDVVITVTATFQLPQALTSPDVLSVVGLPTLTRVRSLTISCVNGSVLMGGVPRPWFVAAPNLQASQVDLAPGIV